MDTVTIDRAISPTSAVEARLLDSPLGRMGGVVLLDDLVDPATVAALAREALVRGATATRQRGNTQAVDDRRSDVAGRALASSGGGPVQDALYESPGLLARLSELCGTRIRPTGHRGSYSYYTRQGDHLDLHVDVRRCDVTVITVLQDSTPRNGVDGALATWSNHLCAPLTTIRESEAAPTAVTKAPPGASVVLLGGILPHAVLPIGATGTRVISPLCFAAD